MKTILLVCIMINGSGWWSDGETPQAAAQSEKMKESRTKATKEGHEPSCLEKFRFQHLWKDVSDKLSNEVAEQVYAKFMDIMDACEKKYRALLNECMANGMSSKYKAFHSKHSKTLIFVTECKVLI
ncbi:hypothetical protein GOBAR_DD08515 [Gossypium barbadense]|nr:hypothetical protein GOBAR_DD08515 [Gossypium barbadense]